jgi:hypothetical protein
MNPVSPGPTGIDSGSLATCCKNKVQHGHTPPSVIQYEFNEAALHIDSEESLTVFGEWGFPDVDWEWGG